MSRKLWMTKSHRNEVNLVKVLDPMFVYHGGSDGNKQVCAYLEDEIQVSICKGISERKRTPGKIWVYRRNRCFRERKQLNSRQMGFTKMVESNTHNLLLHKKSLKLTH